MKNTFFIVVTAICLASCHNNSSTTAILQASSARYNGIDTAREKQFTLRILNKMLLIRGAGNYLLVKQVDFAGDPMLIQNNGVELNIIPAHYLVQVKKNFFKKTSDITDMANLTRPPFYTALDQSQLAQRADAVIAYKIGQKVQLDWKMVFKKDDDGKYERVFPNPENEAELLTPEAYEKLLNEHLPPSE